MLPWQGAQVRSLVGEIRSRMLRGTAGGKKKRQEKKGEENSSSRT